MMTRQVIWKKELNELLVKLNSVIQNAVEDANRQINANQVHFVDVNPRFDNHQWCESNDVHEPDSKRSDTWFFLSGWPDVSVGDASVGITPRGPMHAFELSADKLS